MMPDTSTPENRLRLILLSELFNLPYPAWEQVVLTLLRALGYRDLAILGHRGRRRRTETGGMDMSATALTGVTSTRVVAQLKQYLRPVSRRFVDELRGALLRTHARSGLIITTSRFSKAAERAAAYDALAPIRLIDSEELVTLLLTHRIGIRRTWKGELAVDDDYFTTLRSRFPAASPDCIAQATAVKPALSDQPASSNEPSMLFRTHLMAGISSLWLLNLLPNTITPSSLAPLAAVAAFGSLLPDLDSATSRIANIEIARIRPLLPLARGVQSWLGHRGLLHSGLGLIGITACGLVLVPVWGWQLSAALLLGYASHLLCDAATKRGIPRLRPSGKRFYLLPERLRLTTGSAAEDFVFVLFAALALALLVSHLHA
jgi:membrane-bound metal-dependent hydrolase YbcI (DUF457 family)